ncbi:MAG: Radical domain protein [Candidatus Brocadiaceae bacterium]|nr:Radical domain protein [Candidatus Brocadiaceae bacterium]
MTINIHLIRTRYPHWGQHSGINQFLKYLSHEEYPVEVYLASDNDEDFPIKNKTVRKWLHYFVQRKGMQYYKLSDLTAEIRAFCKCLRNKVDIIHFMDGEHTAQYLPWICRLPRIMRPKIVATYHQPPELIGTLTSKKVISRLDHVTVVSPEQIPYFTELLSPDKITVILHGIDIDFFRPGRESRTDGKFRCITVGHWLRDFKAIQDVAEKLAVYKDIEFHVVSSNKTGPRLTELEGLANVILYRDTINDDGLLKLYQQADILFLPLLQSTANNALLEGIACGLPVVSTYLPSVKAYLPGNEAILIKDNDTKLFIDAILHLFHNPEVCKNMARESRKRAEALDWRNIAPQYEAMYSKVINKNPHYSKKKSGITAKSERLFCSKPFKWFEVTQVNRIGDVYMCCPAWLDTPIGNLQSQSVAEVWNGIKAQEIRRSILDGSFKYCNQSRCPFLHTVSKPVERLEDVTEEELKTVVEKQLTILPYGPREINCSYDKSCNLSCPSCRTEIIIDKKNHKEILKIQRILHDEALKDARLLYITGSGDPFGSPFFRKWLQSMKREDMPNLEGIHLHTNAQLLTPKRWETIAKDIQPLVKSAEISIDAASAETYTMNRRGGSFERLLENLEFVSTLRKHGPLQRVGISMVVQENNFREMPDFINLGKRFHVDTVYFSKLVDWGTFQKEEYVKRAVHLTSHPKHFALVNLLKNEVFKEPIVNLGNLTEL